MIVSKIEKKRQFPYVSGSQSGVGSAALRAIVQPNIGGSFSFQKKYIKNRI